MFSTQTIHAVRA